MKTARRGMPAVFAAVLVVSIVLAGCVVQDEGGHPKIRVDPEHDAWPAGTDNVIMVSFTNTAGRTYSFTSWDSCPFTVRILDAPVRGTTVHLWKEDGPEGCLEAVTDMEIAPGETLRERFIWDGTLSWATDETAPPGTYAIEARFQGESHSWDADATTNVTLLAPTGPGGDTETGTEIPADSQETEDDKDTEDTSGHPRIKVEPGSHTWPQGTDTSIRVSFENTGDEPYRFTSSDGCKDFIVLVRDTGGPRDGDTRLWPPDGPYGCTLALVDYEVDPGETMEATYVWNGTRSHETTDHVEPGTYTIFADFEHTGETSWDASGTANVTITSS